MERIGRYEVIREVGRGGMAIVYQARDTTLDRIVAIKLIRSDIFGSAAFGQIRERFVREARALAKLNHPNIVKVLDYGEHQGAPYLVMEYLKGATLKEVKKPILVETAVRLLRPIAEALDYIHQQGILHRDVKPSNIMLVDGKMPMLTDFGIAKWIEDETDGRSLTGTGVGIGTPEYMAPEQGLGKQVDGRADMYSLTIAFYELITGQKPFRGDTALAILMKQATEPIPDPRAVVPELSESVKRFLDRALAKDPENRYPTFTDYLRDLDGLGLQSIANRARGTLTGIQTTPASTSKTDSSVRIGATDLRKLRGKETRKRKKRPFLQGVFIFGVVALGITGYLVSKKIENDHLVTMAAAETIAMLETNSALETLTEAENLTTTAFAYAIATENANLTATAEEIANIAKTAEARAMTETAIENEKLSEQRNQTATANANYIATADASLAEMANTVAAAETVSAQLTFTANAIATQLAIPTNTPIPPTKTPTPTRTPRPTKTRIPTKTATPTRTPKPSATASVDAGKVDFEINSLMTLQNRYKNYDEVRRTLDILLKEAVKIDVEGSGSIKHYEDDYVESYSEESLDDIKDFILEVTFKNPYSSSHNPFDYGVVFRDSGLGNSQYRLWVDSDSYWQLSNHNGGTKGSLIDAGFVANLKTGAYMKNSILLIVRDRIGLFYVNNRFVAKLDLSDRLNQGSIEIATGFLNGHEKAGYSTDFEKFAVYKLENLSVDSELCQPVSANVVSFYGNYIGNIPNYTNLSGIYGAMVAIEIPHTAMVLNTDWEISTTCDYSLAGQQQKDKGGVRFSCTPVAGRLHCGPMLLNGYVGCGEIKLYPKGGECMVSEFGIPDYMFDQTWKTLGGTL